MTSTTRMTDATTGTHYPTMPPSLDGEDSDAYTNRLTGYTESMGGAECPYDHHRNRQCSIGYHSECSQRITGDKGERTTLGATGGCECPHHTDPRLVAGMPHIGGYARHLADSDTAPGPALDVLIDTLGATDAPLRELAAAWRATGAPDAVACADQLTAVLDGAGDRQARQ